jgi:hypothetical protein
MQDARGLKRAERDLVSRDDLQRCVVCSKWFIRRKGTACSVDCLAKLEGQASPGQ